MSTLRLICRMVDVSSLEHWVTFLLILTFICITTDNLTSSIDEPVEDEDSALHLTWLYGHISCVQVCHLIFLPYDIVIQDFNELLVFLLEVQLLLERGANLEEKMKMVQFLCIMLC